MQIIQFKQAPERNKQTVGDLQEGRTLNSGEEEKVWFTQGKSR